MTCSGARFGPRAGSCPPPLWACCGRFGPRAGSLLSRSGPAEAAEAARVSLHRAREAACARMCAQPPVFVSTTQNKTNKAATGPMFSSFESKITACFREYRTKRKPQGGHRGRNSKEAEARCLQRPVFMSAAPNKTHLPKETKPTCQKKRNPPASDASGLDSLTSRRCQAKALPWLLETAL